MHVPAISSRTHSVIDQSSCVLNRIYVSTISIYKLFMGISPNLGTKTNWLNFEVKKSNIKVVSKPNMVSTTLTILNVMGSKVTVSAKAHRSILRRRIPWFVLYRPKPRHSIMSLRSASRRQLIEPRATPLHQVRSSCVCCCRPDSLELAVRLSPWSVAQRRHF